MATWKMMITVTSEQWLELHKRTLDCIRKAIADLSSEAILWEPPTTRDLTTEPGCDEPRPFCIGAIVAHLCEVETQRIRKLNIRLKFGVPRQTHWNLETFGGIFDLIEEQYHGILAESPKNQTLLFGLGRVCQHNLYHVPQLLHLRCLQDPQWKSPPAGETGSWELAADYITDLLILGDKATRTASQS